MSATRIKILAVFLFTILIFCIIFTYIDIESVIQILSGANLSYLLLSILIIGIIVIISTRRWQIILQTTGCPISFRESFYIIMAAFPLTSITPSKSGDMIKAYYLRDKISVSKTVGGVFTERLFDIFSLLLMSIVGSILYLQVKILTFIIPTFLILTMFFIIPNRNFRVPFINDLWHSRLQNTMLSIRSIMENRKNFFTILAISIVLWLLAMIQIILFFYALDINVPFTFAMANIPIAIFIGFIPITLGGMGTRDTAIIMLFAEYAEPSKLLGVGILFSIFRYWILSLIGIPFMRSMIKSN